MPAVVGQNEELTRLTNGIRADLAAIKETESEKFERYRAVGVKLLQAKGLCPYGDWGDWLKDNFGLSERQAERYMEFAKTDVTSDVRELKRQWSRVNGNGKRRAKAKPSVDDDGTRDVHLIAPTDELAKQFDGVLGELRLMLSRGDTPAGDFQLVLEAVEILREEACRAF